MAYIILMTNAKQLDLNTLFDLILMQAFLCLDNYIGAATNLESLGCILYKTCNNIGLYRIKSVLVPNYVIHSRVRDPMFKLAKLSTTFLAAIDI